MEKNETIILDFVTKFPKVHAAFIAEQSEISNKMLIGKTLKKLVKDRLIATDETPDGLAYSAVESKGSKKSKTTTETDEVKSVPGATNSRNTEKFKFMGKEYGKGRLILAVLQEHIKSQKMTLPKLKEFFPDNLMGHKYGVIQDVGTGKKLSVGRDRYFFDSPIKLKDGKSIVVTSQASAENIKPVLKVFKTLGYKIG